jgi:hypothetical protein
MGFICPVCNYNNLLEPPYSKGGNGSHEICPSCGFQFGYRDFPDKEEGIKKWRENWINNGYPWHSRRRLPPDGWDPRKQIEEL